MTDNLILLFVLYVVVFPYIFTLVVLKIKNGNTKYYITVGTVYCEGKIVNLKSPEKFEVDYETYVEYVKEIKLYNKLVNEKNAI